MTDAHPLRILLVEDAPDHAELAIRSLQEHHLANEVVHVEDGEAALDFLEGRGAYAGPRHRLPDLILLDLRLPKVDGLEVLAHIKSSPTLSFTPVVVLTTSDAEQDLARAYELKANAYVVKPVDFAKFVALMRDLGFFWLAWNKRPRSLVGAS